MSWRPSRQPCDDGINSRKLCHHPDFNGLHVEIAENRVNLRGHEIGGRQMNTGHAARVLRGEGRNDGGAVDTERSERLQVRLDAGAA